VYFSGNESQTQKYTDIYFDNNRQSLSYGDFYDIYYFDNIANNFLWKITTDFNDRSGKVIEYD